MLALGIVAMLCAVAMVGIGFATFGGNARTYNQGNSTTAGYMTLTPVDGGTGVWAGIAVDADVAISTYVHSTGTAYYFAGNSTSPVTVDETQGYTVSAALGTKTFTLANHTGNDISSISFVATPDETVGSANFIYIICVGGVYKALPYTGQPGDIAFAITIDTDDQQQGNQPLEDGDTYDVSVSLHIGYIANCKIPTTWVGPTTETSAPTGTLAINAAAAPASIDSANNGLSFAFKVLDTTQ